MNEGLFAVACIVCVFVLYFMRKAHHNKCDESYNYRPSIGQSSLNPIKRFKRRR